MPKHSTKRSVAKQTEAAIEVWKNVPGYEGYYQVSDQGRVKSLPRIVPMRDGRKYTVSEKYLKQKMTGRYLTVVLCKSGVEETRLVHQLVLLGHVGPCPDGMECRHYDGKCTNNCLTNLRWGTRKENAADRERHGTNRGQAPGEGHTLSKLKDSVVQEIRELHKKGLLDTAQKKRLQKEYRVSETTIRSVRDGRRWKHLL
jgi:hypothetical protein